MKRRVFAFVLAATMFTLAACGNTSTTKTGGEAEGTGAAQTGEIVELKMLSLPANGSGVIEGWWANEVAEKVGVKIDLLPCGDQGEQKLQALMASGELPDIVVFKEYKQVENAVVGDMLLAFDDYKELLPNVYANAESALQYAADNLSNGQNKAFSIGTSVKNDMETRGEKEPWLRYDLYKKAGAPKINEVKDYLDVLKKMQELEPQNADGQKVYGLTLWKDWDRSYMAAANFVGKFTGVEFAGEANLAEIDHTKNREVRSILAENSSYLKFVRFCYEANQMGLLDPDSMTQRFDDAIAKVGSGRILMSLGSWGIGDYNTKERQEQGIGFMPVYTENYPSITEGLEPVGRTWSIAVSKETKHPEAAMRFIDFFYSLEGSMLSENGPKGVMWDVDENNKPYMTEEGYEYLNNPDKELPGGKTFVKGYNITARGLNPANINTEYGVPIGNAYWDKPEYAPADTALVDMWQEDFDAVDSMDYLTKRSGEAALIPLPFVAQPIYIDEMEQISARVGNVITTNSWKMVFAKDKAEYEELKAEMIEKAQGMGIDTFVEWYAAEYQKALDFGAKYEK